MNLRPSYRKPYTRYMKHSGPRGQVLLITVLVLSIAITIALSLIGRGITDVSMSRNVEESARAFSAAEAGIEEALKGKLVADLKEYAPGVKYQSASQIIGGTTGEYTLPATSVGDVASIWLVDHKETKNALDETIYTIDTTKSYRGTSLNICWTPPVDGQQIPAVEVAIYYIVSGVYTVQRTAYDPDITSRPSNQFSSVTAINGTCGAVTGVYQQSVALLGGSAIPLLVRVRPYYNLTTVTVAPVGVDTTLPQQGIEITATGTTDGGVTRKIIVRRQYPWPTAIFDYSVYSQDTFMH